MGQAPLIKPTYLLIGDGKLARHLSFYFTYNKINLTSWSRSQNSDQDLSQKISISDVILIAVKDSAISDFYEKHLKNYNSKTFVHFSGALFFDHIYGFHPLMSFSDQLFTPEFYKNISFISTYHEAEFKTVFPQLDNPSYKISKEQKALYHSYCVVAGNFTNILWQTISKRFQNQLKLPEEVLKPYLEGTYLNLKNNMRDSLTGPLAREDLNTIQANLDSLKGDELQNLYLMFYKFLESEKKEALHEHLEL